MGSQGASRLAEAVRAAGVRAMKVFPDRGYRPRENHLIVNWGSGRTPGWLTNPYLRHVLNLPHHVEVAGNKLLAFRKMQEAGVSIPEFTTDHNVANDWGCTFFGRKKLRGHSGVGIIVFDPEYPHGEGGMYPAPANDNPHTNDNCPLYVKYIKKAAEYRVHVFNGEVIDIQQKRKRRDLDNEHVNYQVRSHSNGWVFCRDNIDIPNPAVGRESIAAMAALGLDFGAVDVIWNSHYKAAYVLEVNTAPGLEGETINKYANKIRELAR
jgi:glutathione synthase/RimK-type ligase-like ATP-grasp enzyme